MGRPSLEGLVRERVGDYVERAKTAPSSTMPLVLEVICAAISDNPEKPIKKDTVYKHMGGAEALRRIIHEAKVVQTRNAKRAATMKPGKVKKPDWEERYRRTLERLVQIEYWAQTLGISKAQLDEIYTKPIPMPDRQHPGTGGRNRHK